MFSKIILLGLIFLVDYSVGSSCKGFQNYESTTASPITTLDSTVTEDVSIEETSSTITTTRLSTKDSYTTLDPTQSEVSDGTTSTITPDSSTTEAQKCSTMDTTTTDEDVRVSLITEDSTSADPQEGEISTEVSHTSLDTSTTDKGTSLTTPTTEPEEGLTTSSPRDPTTFCSENKEVGTFRAEGDTTCKRYYICTSYKGGFKGYEYDCGENYFNPEISLCQKEKPDNC